MRLMTSCACLQELVAESQVSTGPAMMFATVDYEGCCNKSATEKVTGKWSSLLRSAGMDANLCATFVSTDSRPATRSLLPSSSSA